MKHEHIGWLLIGGGAILQVAETMAHTTASLDNITFPETPVGKFVAPLETFLPVSLGWTLLITGAIVCWVLPYLKGK